jgi:hypothetical protein
MPTLSASEYTQFLKYKAAAATPIRPDIQTRSNATLSQGVLNSAIFASQAALVVTPSLTVVQGNARIEKIPVVQTRSTPDAKATLSFAGTSGALSSSATTRPGGLPTGFKGSQNTYHRIPQNAGWIQGNMISSGQKRF